jgi:choline dehydrogenase-like flavoprotein
MQRVALKSEAAYAAFEKEGLPMDARRLSTFRTVAEIFVPDDARIERVMRYAESAVEELSPGRRAEVNQLMDLLALPMKLPPNLRTGFLRSFADAPISLLRTGFAMLKRLILFCAYAESEPDDANPTWARLGYPGPRADRGADDPPLPYATATANEVVRADVVIIGSGAGGGVAASAFARAGKRVVVLEAGPPSNARSFDQRELTLKELYLEAGLSSTEDLGLALFAGSTVGGGTAINWCTSLRMPERIASEWSVESGIATLGDELAPHYTQLEQELGLASLERHNANNQVIVSGAKALGIHCAAMPRNAPSDCGEGCGYCGFGCAYGKKRSTSRTFLPDIATGGGALYANAKAIRIVLEGRRAKSVTVLQRTPTGSVTFEVVAGLIVVAAGSLRSPGILARSGIKCGALGQTLHLHPTAALLAGFDSEISPYLGPMQSAYSDAYNFRAGNYGAKIEVAPSHPGLAAMAIPWQSRQQHADALASLRTSALLIALTRDRDPGSIDLDDEAYIRYRVSPFDGENMIEGILGMMDLAFAAGAARATTLHNTPIVIERDQWTTPRRAALADTLRRIGVASNRQIFFSAHQMGTCAMGASESTSVVDPAGRVWGYDNLIVTDASIFPQASGVNPMLTIMAMASRVAEQNGGSLQRSARAVATGAPAEYAV